MIHERTLFLLISFFYVNHADIKGRIFDLILSIELYYVR